MTQDSHLNIQVSAVSAKRRAARDGRPMENNAACTFMRTTAWDRAPSIQPVLGWRSQFQEMLRQVEAQDCADLVGLEFSFPAFAGSANVGPKTRRALGEALARGGAPFGTISPKALRPRNWIIVANCSSSFLAPPTVWEQPSPAA